MASKSRNSLGPKPPDCASETGLSHTFAYPSPSSTWTCGGSLRSLLQKKNRKPRSRQTTGTDRSGYPSRRCRHHGFAARYRPASVFDDDFVADLSRCGGADRKLDGALGADKQWPEPPGLDAAQHVRHAIVLVDVQDVERHAHEPHVNPAAGLEHQAAPGGQLAAAHESPEARPERRRQLGAVGQNLVAAAVHYSNAAHHDS